MANSRRKRRSRSGRGARLTASTRRTIARFLARRAAVVWIAFIVMMTAALGVFALDDSKTPGGYLVATNIDALGELTHADRLFTVDGPLDRQRWRGIVIHHLGLPAGDAERVHRLHLSYGYQGLGYHFLIGNGRGLGDGIVHVGYRWTEQKPGAHVAAVAENSAWYNEHALGICLVGNGDRRPFTDRQMRSLVALVRRLQEELGIPADQVRLHRDLGPEISSPGSLFPAATFYEQLRR